MSETLLQIDKAVSRVFAPPTCRKCGGKCCQAYPGSASPIQFGAPDRERLKTNLVRALRSGNWQVDWYECEERGYFLRPAIVGDHRIKSPSWGGRCTFLTERGCKLTARNRPSECAAVKPDPLMQNCTGDDGGKLEYSQRWKPYWDDIDAAVEAVEVKRQTPHRQPTVTD